jgi:hypothetical protein
VYFQFIAILKDIQKVLLIQRIQYFLCVYFPK